MKRNPKKPKTEIIDVKTDEAPDKEKPEKYFVQKDRGLQPAASCPHCGKPSFSYWNANLAAYTAYCSDIDQCGAVLGPCSTREEAATRWAKRHKTIKS
jgi:hypothetical protein